MPRLGCQRTNLLSLEKRIRGNVNRSSPPVTESGKVKCPAEEAGGRSLPGQCHPEGNGPGKLLNPDRHRQTVQQTQEVFDVSERRVCRALGQPRSTQRYVGRTPRNEELSLSMTSMASSIRSPKKNGGGG